MTTTDVRTEYVDEELLARFDERAPKYDHDNEFFGFGGPDAREGLTAHTEKREPTFRGPTSE